MLAAVLTLAASAKTATTAEFDLLVRITPDSAVGQVNTQNGYTVSIINTTASDLAFDQVRFLLPGHGGNALDEEIYGEPVQSLDDSPAFNYVPGSTSGVTTADPTTFERWLTWGGGIVGASTTATLHFNVTLSEAPAYYWTGATVAVSGGTTVQGTKKGGQIQVISADQFAMTMEAPREVQLGSRIPYTGTLTNNSDLQLTVKSVKIGGVRHGRYVPNSTSGAMSVEPTEKGNGYIWKELFDVPPHSSVQFGFEISADVVGTQKITSRSNLLEPLPDGQSFAGTGPTAFVKIVN
jgi:hypothetical protein